MTAKLKEYGHMRHEAWWEHYTHDVDIGYTRLRIDTTEKASIARKVVRSNPMLCIKG